MVRLTMTPAIVQALERLQGHDQLLQTNEEPLLDKPATGKPISHGQIVAISKALKEDKGELQHNNLNSSMSYHLDDLLRGSKVYIEPRKPKNEPTSEYKALMARLRRQEEERAYERMINPPLPTETFSQRFPKSSQVNLFPTAQEDIGEDDEISYADINRQVGLIINIVVSIVACSVAIWLAARHWSTPSRLGLSMGGSIAVAVAEAVVYAGYLRRLKEAREKGKKEVEVKEIIKSWVIGGEGDKASQDVAIPIMSNVSQDDKFRRRNPKRN